MSEKYLWGEKEGGGGPIGYADGNHRMKMPYPYPPKDEWLITMPDEEMQTTFEQVTNLFKEIYEGITNLLNQISESFEAR